MASSQDIDQVEQITDNITLPGVERDSGGGVVRYVSAKMVIFRNYLDAVIAVFYGWFGHDDTEGVQKTWKEWFSDTLATGVRYIWNHWFGEAPTEQSEGSGVQKNPYVSTYNTTQNGQDASDYAWMIIEANE